jgi:hypothetical protein
MYEFTIICTKYGNFSQMTLQQQTDFSEYEKRKFYECCLRYWDCDDINLTAEKVKKVA